MPEAGARARSRTKQRVSGKTAPQRSISRWWIFAAATLAAVYLAFQVYAPALNGPFVFDDADLPYHQPNFPDALRDWAGGVRPLLMLSYWLNHQLSAKPPGFHVFNVFFHVVNSILLFFIIRKLLEDAGPGSHDALAAFAAAIFLLHPIQTEAVAYIAGRSECLSVLFFFAAFAIFLYRRRRAASWKTAIAVLALFGGAVATKEHTLVLTGLLLLTDYYWNPGFSFTGIRRNWRIYIPIALGSAAGLVLLIRMLAHASSAGFGVREFTWYQYFLTECRAFFVYLRLLAFPAGQNVDWDYPVSRNILDHRAILALAAIVILAGAAIYFRRRYPLASYGFLVYLLLMAPTSSFVPIKDPLAERRLYLPMIGMLLVMTGVMRRIQLDRRKPAIVAGFIVVALAVLTHQRNQLWASDIALWEDTVHKSPAKARVHYQLAFVYYGHGRCREAVAQYAETARLQKPDHHLLVDWGLAHECAGQPDQAIARLREAAALKPTAHVFSQIGMVYARQSRWPEALEALAQAERLDRNYAMTYYYRGGVRASTHDFAGAVADYQRVLALDPSSRPAREALVYAERQLNLH